MEEQQQATMSRKEFFIRLGVWSAFAVIIPIIFIAVRYGLFSDSGTSLSGWGITAVVIACAFFMYIMKSAKKGLPEGSMLRQCIDGFAALIPVLGLLLLLHSIKNTVDCFEQVLVVVLLCEAVAVPVNPMPKWAAQHKEEKVDGFIKRLVDAFKKG